MQSSRQILRVYFSRNDTIDKLGKEGPPFLVFVQNFTNTDIDHGQSG